VSSFTEKNLPLRQARGPRIPEGVRQSIFTILGEHGASPTLLWETLARRQGYGTYKDASEDIEERFDTVEAEAFDAAMNHAIEVNKRRNWSVTGVNYLAEPALLALPEALFLDAVEYGVRHIGSYPGRSPHVDEINALFKRRGIYFELDVWQGASWVGDPGAYGATVEPALAALVDPRLNGVRAEFEVALRHLRHGTHKDLEDAIEESGKSVESAMKVLLDEKSVRRTGKETAHPLFELLRDAGVIEVEADNSVLGAARIRNQWGGHGAGATPRTPPGDLAELAVRAAATAIVFLAGRL
jgi:hypothetical protein